MLCVTSVVLIRNSGKYDRVGRDAGVISPSDRWFFFFEVVGATHHSCPTLADSLSCVHTCVHVCASEAIPYSARGQLVPVGGMRNYYIQDGG